MAMRVVAIDGPAGAGKSTVARAVAARLGLDCLGTGTMYRAVAVAVLDRCLAGEIGPDLADADVVAVAEGIDIVVGTAAGDDDAAAEQVLVDGEDVTTRVRGSQVGLLVSVVAAVPEVRARLVALQRDWVRAHGGAVVEGRDIGSVVFPDAELKVFLTASPEERARRRDDEDADGVRRRDHLDATRTASPLVVPDGAVVIDSTGRSIDDVVDQIVGLLG